MTSPEPLPAAGAGRHGSEDAVVVDRGGSEDALVADIRGEFMDLVGHELRSPLTNILVLAELLSESDLPEEARAQAEVIRHEAARLARLIEGVLDISRAHHEQLALDVAPLDLAALCSSILRRAAVVHADREWRLVAPTDVPRVLADASRTEQILRNLLENAEKYSPAGEPVEVSLDVAAGGARVRCTVADHGPGIPPEEAERVFGRHQRLALDGDRRAGGHGLGLYIARRFVELQGGTIWADCRPGEGARFVFELPAAPEAPAGPGGA